MYLICSKYGFNLVYTCEFKGEAVVIIRKKLTVIENKYNRKPEFIRIDNKRTLDKTFKILLIEKNIIYKSSAPYTSAQNKYLKRIDRIIAIKARVIRIQIKLSLNLWPEIIKTATYIVNKTSIKRYGWKIPFEDITKAQPDLRHLYIYKCKAYALNKNISRKKKLKKQAHINYLIDYNSTNIFRIWIPSRSRVIRTKNVLFDENTYYTPKNLNALQIVSKLILKTIYNKLLSFTTI